MGEARPLFKVDRNVDWQARCVKGEERLAACKKELADLEQRVAAAERNSRRFHALLLAERIRKLPARRNP